MNNENAAVNITTHQSKYVPISFCLKNGWEKTSEFSLSWENDDDVRKTFHKLFHCERKVDRGTVCLPMNTVDEQLDAAKYIQFIEYF